MAHPRGIDEVIDLTRRLVAIDTTSNRSNLAAAELVAERLDSLGARVEIQRWKIGRAEKANVVASLGPPEPGGLIVSGHLDTVPFASQPGWTREPLRLAFEGDRVFGRGTSDMKGFVAQALVAAGRIGQSDLRRPLVFLFTADEETGCAGALRLAGEIDTLLGEVPRPRLAWIGEPTSWAIFHAHKAIGVFDVTVHGRGGHSGLPGFGVNAITVAGRITERLRSWQECERSAAEPSEVFPEVPFTTLNLGTITGGSAANMIAEECRLRVSFRALPSQSPRAVFDAIAAAIAEVEPVDGSSPHRARVEIGEPDLVPGMLSQRGSPLEAALSRITGESSRGGALFAADGCRFDPLGITTLICGPGDFGEAHQANESISRRALGEGEERIERVIHEICGPGSR